MVAESNLDKKLVLRLMHSYSTCARSQAAAMNANAAGGLSALIKSMETQDTLVTVLPLLVLVRH